MSVLTAKVRYAFLSPRAVACTAQYFVCNMVIKHLSLHNHRRGLGLCSVYTEGSDGCGQFSH